MFRFLVENRKEFNARVDYILSEELGIDSNHAPLFPRINGYTSLLNECWKSNLNVFESALYIGYQYAKILVRSQDVNTAEDVIGAVQARCFLFENQSLISKTFSHNMATHLAPLKERLCFLTQKASHTPENSQDQTDDSAIDQLMKAFDEAGYPAEQAPVPPSKPFSTLRIIDHTPEGPQWRTLELFRSGLHYFLRIDGILNQAPMDWDALTQYLQKTLTSCHWK